MAVCAVALWCASQEMLSVMKSIDDPMCSKQAEKWTVKKGGGGCLVM